MPQPPNATLRQAVHAARRFQLATSLAPGRARTRAIRREGQALADLLHVLGFRPGGAAEPEAPPPPLLQRAAAM